MHLCNNMFLVNAFFQERKHAIFLISILLQWLRRRNRTRMLPMHSLRRAVRNNRMPFWMIWFFWHLCTEFWRMNLIFHKIMLFLCLLSHLLIFNLHDNVFFSFLRKRANYSYTDKRNCCVKN